jgi:hypothetical protein
MARRQRLKEWKAAEKKRTGINTGVAHGQSNSRLTETGSPQALEECIVCRPDPASFHAGRGWDDDRDPVLS